MFWIESSLHIWYTQYDLKNDFDLDLEYCIHKQISLHILMPGAVAWLEACPFGMQAAPHSFLETWSWKISTAILPLLLIQEKQLSVMCTKYW